MTAIRRRLNVYFRHVNPNQLHSAAATTAGTPAETTAAPAVPAPAPAVTANQASQVEPSTEGQINMAPTLTAEQQALIAALSPKTIATLLALAQAAGSLPKPAASTTSAVEPTRRGKRKPACAAGVAEQAGEARRKSRRPTEETATAESKKIKGARIPAPKPQIAHGSGGMSGPLRPDSSHRLEVKHGSLAEHAPGGPWTSPCGSTGIRHGSY